MSARLRESWTVADAHRGNLERGYVDADSPTPDAADAAAFDAALTAALDTARTLRRDAETLSNSIESDAPEGIRRSSQRFENATAQARSVFDRLRVILREANHHTLESAYAALVAQPGRSEEANQMRSLITEFRRTRAIIARSGQRLDDALRDMTAPALASLHLGPGHGPEDDEGSGVHAEA